MCLLKWTNSFGFSVSQVMLVVKNPPANAGDSGDLGSMPGSGRPPRGGHGNPLRCSCLESPMGRGAWWATVRGLAKSRTRLNKSIGAVTWNKGSSQCLWPGRPSPSPGLLHPSRWWLLLNKDIIYCQQFVRDPNWSHALPAFIAFFPSEERKVIL